MSHGGKDHQLKEKEENQTAEQKRFAELLDKFDYDFNRGDIIKGRVVRYESNGAMVDIGAKCLAYLPGKEVGASYQTPIEEALPLNEEMEFFILREDESEERFILSRTRARRRVLRDSSRMARSVRKRCTPPTIALSPTTPPTMAASPNDPTAADSPAPAASRGASG